jgi:DNA polymerase elongation subunit (family B)
MINSIYGMIGTAFSPIYNIHMAQTITRTGKYCNIMASQHVKEVFNERFGNKHEITIPEYLRTEKFSEIEKIVGFGKAYKTYLISGDTDSAIFSTKINIRRN